MTYSVDSSINGGDHHLGAPVVARLDGDDAAEAISPLSPSARKLLEVSMHDEDPLLAKKRIERRISNRNVIRHKDSVTGESQKKEEKSSDIFKPWDDKPDVTLSVNPMMQARKRPPPIPKQLG